MDFKTVLAGPIVRRVDAASASVWLALDQPCDVTLRVWAGLESAATSRAPAFSGRRRTRRVGSGETIEEEVKSSTASETTNALSHHSCDSRAP
jgi:hypothetical protein